MITAVLRQTTCTFRDDGSVYVAADVELRDDVLGSLGVRTVPITDPAILAGVKQTAVALTPATELALGVPLALPTPPAPPAPPAP